MMERDAAYLASKESQAQEFNRLMKGNKKADLAQMVLNEERVARMWRDTAQMNDERIHQLEQDNLKLQEDMDKLLAAKDFNDIVHAEVVGNHKKEKKRLELDSARALELLKEARAEVSELKEQTKLITETLAGHRDSYIKVFDQLEKYHTGVLLHTDGTVNGTTFMINGEIPHKMSTVRIKANIMNGVQASYEVMETDRAERKWVYGELSEPNLEYVRRHQAHKEYREDRVRAMILEAAARNNRTAPKLPKKLPEINKWECSHCWAPNYLKDTIHKKDRMKCGVCYQWTKAVEVKK